MAPVRIWGNANGSDSKSANWKIESSEHSRDFRVAPTLWKGASPETKTAHLRSSMKDIRKCFGKNRRRSAAQRTFRGPLVNAPAALFSKNYFPAFTARRRSAHTSETQPVP